MSVAVPSILEYSVADVRKRAEQVKGLVERVQLDIVDGVFAKPPTWPFVGDDGSFEHMKSGEEKLPSSEEIAYEIDMMVTSPERFVEGWIIAGARCLVIHRMSTDFSTLTQIHTLCVGYGVEFAIAIRPSEPHDFLHEWVEKIAFLQIMGSDTIGVQGTAFDTKTLKKISTLHREHPNLMLGVDIGVNRETAPKIVEAGAAHLSIGSGIFKADDKKSAIQWFQALGNHGLSH